MAELSTESLPPTASGQDSKDLYNGTGFGGFHVHYAPRVTISSITLIICLLGLVGNGIVLWLLGFRMKRSPFTIYVLNLAVADTGFLLFSVAHLVAFVLGYKFCDCTAIFYMLLLFTSHLTYSTSLYLLTAISTERCVSVLYPIWHRCRRPSHLSAIMSALLWALSCLLCCPVAIFCLDPLKKSCITSLLPISVLNVLIFTPIMVLSSLILFVKVRRSSQRRPPGKLYAVILVTVLFFLLFTLPQSLHFFMCSCNVFKHSEIFHILACANSSINPFIYFFVGSYGKQRICGSLKVALQRVFEEQIYFGESTDTQSTNRKETVPPADQAGHPALGMEVSCHPEIIELQERS
ncbi:mas-related G-protein coupled receptor member H-like [Pelodiscus sinensis]|uniref:mas-related G-protein coupled receptor member H-like n=1 Tax=Pelodiscus sinensis TaxID=13735 RepID=UPI003F6C2714